MLFAIPGDAGEVRRADEARAADAGAERETNNARVAPTDEVLPPVAVASSPSPVTREATSPTAAAREGASTQKTEQLIGVVLRRETAEFTLPVTEAAVPDALLRNPFELIGTAPARDQLQQQQLVLLGQARQVTPSTTGAMPTETLDADTQDDEPPLFTEPDIEIRIDDISRRFRPPSAE